MEILLPHIKSQTEGHIKGELSVTANAIRYLHALTNPSMELNTMRQIHQHNRSQISMQTQFSQTHNSFLYQVLHTPSAYENKHTCEERQHDRRH